MYMQIDLNKPLKFFSQIAQGRNFIYFDLIMDLVSALFLASLHISRRYSFFRIVNLVGVSLRVLHRVFRARTARTAVRGFCMPRRTSCSPPCSSYITRRPNTYTIYFSQNSVPLDMCKGRQKYRRGKIHKSKQLVDENFVGAICRENFSL